VTSKRRGKHTSVRSVEVLNISLVGLWILAGERELLVPFDAYPRFLQATVQEIHHVEMLHGVHLHWPDIDVDVEIEALLHPERYPLAYREGTKPTASR